MAQSTAKGGLALTIDEDELEARLVFTPDPNGAEWTAEKILRVLMDARIGGFNPKRTEELVGKFARAKGSVAEVVASGQAPEQPQAEFPEWCELPIPPEMQAIAADIVAGAPPPLLYKITSETVKVEKTVKKPAALPFLPPKIEKVVVVEKREKREQIYTDTTIERSGWAEKGQRLGILSVFKAGKPGKTIFGKPLQPRIEDGNFYVGPGASRNRNELLADVEGVVRIGERWVDVVGVPRHRWTVEASPDGATYVLNYSPGDARFPAPQPMEILAAATELGAPPDGLLDEAEVVAILAESMASGTAVAGRSLSQDRDAKIEIKLSSDGSLATLTIVKGRGRGKALDLSELSTELKKSGVRGFKPEQLKKDVLEFFKGPQSEFKDYVLAEGRAASRGKDRVLALSLALLPGEKAAALRDRLAVHPGLSQAVPSLESFPIAEATKVALVQLGQKIGELSPPSPGQDGVDIFGKPIPGIPGNDPAIRAFEGIDFSKGQLTSTVPGIILASDSGGVWRLRVLRFRDSSIDVSIAADALSASLSLVPEEGLGSALNVERVLEALAAKGVVQGVEPYAVAEAVAEARAGKPVLKRAVAHARAPKSAGSVKVEWLVKKASGALYSLAKGDRVDFHEHDTMTRIAAGDPILSLTVAGGAGEDGIDVLGRVIKASSDAAGERVPEHDATIREEEGQGGRKIFVAAAGGELVDSGGKLSIREHLAVKGDVGSETGNIKFPGVVQVAGSLLAGFSLVAGGDASVAGAVEAALLSSDGSIHVGEGVKGARKGMVRARGGIDAAFAEQALLLAVEDIKIKNACVLCSVKTNGKLFLSSEKGALIGGLCRARKGIDVAALGSENYVKTEVSFGQDYLVADQIDAEEHEIEKLKGLILQTDRTMADLEKAGTGLDRVRQDKVKLVKLLEKRSHRLFDLRERFEEHCVSEVRVRGSVYPGVILESHNRFFEVRSLRTKVAFAFDSKVGRIVERPL